MIRAIFAVIALLFTLHPPLALAKNGGSAVILSYSRIEDDLHPDQNLSAQLFQSHIDTLLANKANILPIGQIIDTVKNDPNSPNRAIAITFDGAFKSAFTHAMPILIAKKIPFTVFFSSDKATQNDPHYMNWDDLKSLTRYPFIEIGIHPSSYTRATEHTQQQNKEHLNKALLAARQHLGIQPEVFAFPFGEYPSAYREILKPYDFKAAFGMQSGAFGPKTDILNIPRFTMTERYGDIERLKLVIQAKPLPYYDLEPAEFHITQQSVPVIGFSVPDSYASLLKNLSCFLSNQGRAETVLIGENRIEIRPTEPFEDRRIRINCTAIDASTAQNDTPEYYWFGLLFTNAL